MTSNTRFASLAACIGLIALLSGCSAIIDTKKFDFSGEDNTATDDSESDTADLPGDSEGMGGTDSDTPEAETDSMTTGTDDDTDSDSARTDTESDTADTEIEDTETADTETADTSSETDTAPDDTDSDTPTDSETTSDGDCDGWLDKDHLLCWENPAGSRTMNFTEAKNYCTDKGEGWTLPDIDQLRMLVRECEGSLYRTDYNNGTLDNGATVCTVDKYTRDFNTTYTPTGCEGCRIAEGPGDGCYWEPTLEMTGGACEAGTDFSETTFWSTTTNYDDIYVWRLDFNNAEISSITDVSTARARIRCVKAAD